MVDMINFFCVVKFFASALRRAERKGVKPVPLYAFPFCSPQGTCEIRNNSKNAPNKRSHFYDFSHHSNKFVGG